mmetsp:Transcript_5202/g.8790  ORF Transcript_5202/g.8790 Transcript_5202/m.8790 type:complete len:122 (-) Transcript_5202:149-514(-)
MKLDAAQVFGNIIYHKEALASDLMQAPLASPPRVNLNEALGFRPSHLAQQHAERLFRLLVRCELQRQSRPQIYALDVHANQLRRQGLGFWRAYLSNEEQRSTRIHPLSCDTLHSAARKEFA